MSNLYSLSDLTGGGVSCRVAAVKISNIILMQILFFYFYFLSKHLPVLVILNTENHRNKDIF